MALQDLTPQLRTRLGRVERLVGVFLLVAFSLLIAGFIYFIRHTAKARGWFLESVPYFTYVRDATGISPGAPVKMMGFNIGEVIEVEQADDSEWNISMGYFVFVKFRVRDPYYGYVLDDSTVRIGAGDLLGSSRSLEVTRGSKAGILTIVTNSPSRHLAHLDPDYAFKSGNEKARYRHYFVVTNKSKGFFLSADEQVPLPEKLTRIANDLHAALPGVLAMTNSIHLTLATMSQGLTNLNEITAQMNSIMPKLQSAIGEAEGLLKDIRPLTQMPGGIGTLLIPTNLNLQLTSVLSNVNSRAELIGPTLSNINGVVGEVGETVAGIRAQLDRDTNLVSNINRLADTARSLADTAETLLKRHWFFRSAFKGKTNSVDGPSEPKANARPIHPSKW